MAVALLDQDRRVDLAHGEEMRRLLPAARDVLGHRAPQGRLGRGSTPPACSTSSSRIAPPGPVPFTFDRSTPRSAARRRALGEAAARPRDGPRPHCLPGAAVCGPGGTVSAARGRADRAPGGEPADSPGARIIAIAWPTATSSPSAAVTRGQRAGRRRLDLDRRLVGLDLHQRLALGDLLTLPLQPADELAGLLGHAESRHDDVSRDRLSPSRLRGAPPRRPGLARRGSGSTAPRASSAATRRRCSSAGRRPAALRPGTA